MDSKKGNHRDSQGTFMERREIHKTEHGTRRALNGMTPLIMSISCGPRFDQNFVCKSTLSSEGPFLGPFLKDCSKENGPKLSFSRLVFEFE